jgi:hypothetical protein
MKTIYEMFAKICCCLLQGERVLMLSVSPFVDLAVAGMYSFAALGGHERCNKYL